MRLHTLPASHTLYRTAMADKVKEVETFNKGKLKHVTPAEKNPLPTKEQIAEEKKASK